VELKLLAGRQKIVQAVPAALQLHTAALLALLRVLLVRPLFASREPSSGLGRLLIASLVPTAVASNPDAPASMGDRNTRLAALTLPRGKEKAQRHVSPATEMQLERYTKLYSLWYYFRSS
jgi:hypothetical protein